MAVETKALLVNEDESSDCVQHTYDTSRSRWSQKLRTPQSWILALAIHLSMLSVTVALLFLIARRHLQNGYDAGAQTNAHPTAYNPASAYIRYKVDKPPASYWENTLYTGEPTYTGDYMWNDLMDYQGLRLEKEEGERLNVSAAPLPNGGFATMFGVYHNLHCLRRIRQHLFEDYYYPNRSASDRDEDIHHNYHCLEAVRTSTMCHPDLTPHPLRWAENMPNHPLLANPDVERECVDWDYLHQFVKTRKYHLPQVLEGMREVGRAVPGDE